MQNGPTMQKYKCINKMCSPVKVHIMETVPFQNFMFYNYIICINVQLKLLAGANFTLYTAGWLNLYHSLLVVILLELF